jgi:hypothetical protein
MLNNLSIRHHLAIIGDQGPDNGAPELAWDIVELLLALILLESPDLLTVSPFRLPAPPFPPLPHIWPV